MGTHKDSKYFPGAGKPLVEGVEIIEDDDFKVVTSTESVLKPNRGEWSARDIKTLTGQGGYAEPVVMEKCRHRGQIVVGVDGLIGSSYRGGLVVPGNSVTVLLTTEALASVIPAGWATWHSENFNSHLRGALVYWPWVDMSTPKGDSVLPRIAELHQLHKAGKIIEVACFGGHGRTGTLLAILAALADGWPANKAVAMLRERYCDKAIETKGQEEFVRLAITTLREGGV